MLDTSQVKLREFKKASKIMTKSSSPISGSKPSWLEELSKKQANRKSLGVVEDVAIEMKVIWSRSEDEGDIKESAS